MRPRRFILPQAGTGGYGIRPYVFEAAEHPHRGGAPRGAFSLWSKAKSVGAHSICARGGLPLPQAGTGGYGIRPYVFKAAEHQPSRGVTAGERYSFRGAVFTQR